MCQKINKGRLKTKTGRNEGKGKLCRRWKGGKLGSKRNGKKKVHGNKKGGVMGGGRGKEMATRKLTKMRGKTWAFGGGRGTRKASTGGAGGSGSEE